jgi:hypothetical protein
MDKSLSNTTGEIKIINSRFCLRTFYYLIFLSFSPKVRHSRDVFVRTRLVVHSIPHTVVYCVVPIYIDKRVLCTV